MDHMIHPFITILVGLCILFLSAAEEAVWQGLRGIKSGQNEQSDNSIYNNIEVDYSPPVVVADDHFTIIRGQELVANILKNDMETISNVTGPLLVSRVEAEKKGSLIDVPSHGLRFRVVGSNGVPEHISIHPDGTIRFYPNERKFFGAIPVNIQFSYEAKDVFQSGIGNVILQVLPSQEGDTAL